MKKVIHLVPYDGIGGVETAARSMIGNMDEKLEFEVDYIFRPTNSRGPRPAFLNPAEFLRATYRNLLRKPDLLIVSLWRSCIVGVLLKACRPRLRLVLFLHFPNDVHWLDRLLTRLTAGLAQEIWADSKETLARRVPHIPAVKGRVISFVTHRVCAVAPREARPVFVFWGRIHPQKGLDRALYIFGRVRGCVPAARFKIIGPDGGDCGRIRKLVAEMGLSNAVCLLGAMGFNAITQEARSASFYLQTSRLEGMAMSVVEAMQLGLVPIVTPVGEIADYCRHGENALVVRTDEAIVGEIVAVLHDEARFQGLREGAVATWADKPLYGQSVFLACADILRQSGDDLL